MEWFRFEMQVSQDKLPPSMLMDGRKAIYQSVKDHRRLVYIIVVEKTVLFVCGKQNNYK